MLNSQKKIDSKIRKALYTFRLLENISRLGVALSGGKDSLSLLFCLKEILGRGFPKLPLAAFHVEGAFSCGAGVSRIFLERHCVAWGIPFFVKQSSHKDVASLECYGCSRERRRLLFSAAKAWGAEAIAFGHHRDDNIQTCLMNLLHKGEFAGMLPRVPMHEYGITILRPMLFVEEKEVIVFAKEMDFLRVTCQCPIGQGSLRKKTEGLLREIEVCFPHARDNLSRATLLYGSTKAMKPSRAL